MKESPKTVDMFIRKPEEAYIKQFFMNDINALLEKYDPGKPDMKPEVLEQIKKIQAEREKLQQQQMMQHQQQQQNPSMPKIMVNEPGKPPRELTIQEIMDIMNKQIQEIQQLREENAQLKQFITSIHNNTNNVPS
jgi:seryl-tRNA synthetase